MKPQSPLAGSGTASGACATQASLKTVERIRNVFPETWFWSSVTTGYMSEHIDYAFSYYITQTNL